MKQELQDKAWRILPVEFREEVKKEYAKCVAIDIDDNPNLPAYAVESAISRRALLENLFGRHNLTSDAEGEEMLTVPRKDIVELYREVQKTISQCKGTGLATQAIGIRSVIWSFFGSKCLPDDTNLSEKLTGSEPKFRKDEKVRIKGVAGFDVIKAIYGTGKDGYRYELVNEIAIYDESDLEPYTEPAEEASPNVNSSDIDIDELVAKGCVPDPAKQFDNILKDSFSKERRLTIAAQMMQGLICAPLIPGVDPNPSAEYLAQAAFRLADALIAEAEKEDCYSSELTDKLNGK